MGIVAVPIPWTPVLKNRADGVDGHYAIGRFNPSGYWEFWNLISHRWASASEEVLTFDEANSLLRGITLPTAPEVPLLVEALEELIDLMEDIRQGEYTPDSFTTQPARIALAAYRKKATAGRV